MKIEIEISGVLAAIHNQRHPLANALTRSKNQQKADGFRTFVSKQPVTTEQSIQSVLAIKRTANEIRFC
jgi:hypothetical protein